MTDRLDRLIADAAACLTCGKEHRPHPSPRGGIFADDWGDPTDGHPYRPRLPLDVDVEWLRAWSEANPE